MKRSFGTGAGELDHTLTNEDEPKMTPLEICRFKCEYKWDPSKGKRSAHGLARCYAKCATKYPNG
ncbi:MAG: hypothetical protein RLZZ283_280 [Candidatus Parcubacteria bacterium]|jgi:hypothetical protein